MLSDIQIYQEDCASTFSRIENDSADLVVYSPPYNISKAYEKKRLELSDYVEWQVDVFKEAYRVCSPKGSICVQIGNHVAKSGEVIPLDCLLFNRFRETGAVSKDRIIWTFEHGLHCRNRFSGRHESILWFAKNIDCIFNLDEVRVPQKYPGKKYFQGPKKGQLSCNPAGKNPGNCWSIPNVKHNHVEKTEHPCQFPLEIAGKLISALTNKDGLVVDPFLGAGTTAAACVLLGRRFIGCDLDEEYCRIANERVSKAQEGVLPVRRLK